MSLIRNDKVLFYHPLDSDTEYTQSVDWIRSANGTFDTGVVVSGFTQDGATDVDITGVVASGYDDLEGYDHFTVAFWASGLYGGVLRDDRLKIGFGSTDVSDGNGIQCFISEAGAAAYIRLYKRGASGPLKQIPIIPSTEGWHLTIVDMSLQGSVFQYLVSINGSGWQNIGSGHNADLPDVDAKCLIQIELESTSNNIILDEVAIWAGQDVFTNNELSNIYELANTYNNPLSQYTSTFGTLVSSGVDCFITGHLQASGDSPLYIPGQIETKSASLFMLVNSPSNGNIDSFIHGHQVASGDVYQFIHGSSTTSGNADLYISGIPAISSSVNLYTQGPTPASGDVDSSIWGHLPISGNSTLFMQGAFPRFDAFVSVVANNPSNTLNLSIHGIASGAPTSSHINDSATLFIKDDGEDKTVDSSWSVFTRVADAIAVTENSTWSSFLRGGNTANDNIGLYLFGHAPGEAPHGTLVSGSISAFIEGQSTQDGEEGLLSDGYSVSNIEAAAFAKVHLGLNGTSNLYVSGEVIVVPPSATFDLFTFGILGTAFDSSTAYIFGQDIVDKNFDLFIFGIQDVKSNDAVLYIEVTDIGLFNQSSTLYSHGF